MGMGFCCCGDEVPPGTSGSSMSSYIWPKNVNCAACANLMPSRLSYSITPVSDYAPYISCSPPTLWSSICESHEGGVVEFLRNNASGFLYSRSSNSCDYATDCYLATNKVCNVLLSNPRCTADNSLILPTCGTRPKAPLGVSSQNYYHLCFFRLSGTWYIKICADASDANGDPLPSCTTLNNRCGCSLLTLCVSSVTTSCNPFFYEGTHYIPSLGSDWLRNHINPSCCVVPIGSSASLFVGFTITISE